MINQWSCILTQGFPNPITVYSQPGWLDERMVDKWIDENEKRSMERRKEG